MICSSALASPLTDYSKGKTSIDVTNYPSLSSHITNNNGYDQSPKCKSSYDIGITTGLGDKLAIQYRNFTPETKAIKVGSAAYETIENKNQEINVLYKLDKNTSAFIGFHWTDYKDITNDTGYSLSVDCDTKKTPQIGVVANYPISNKANLFGVIGIGNNYTNAEIGISHNLSSNFELNVIYRKTNINNIRANDVSIDTEYRGIGYGLTYKF
jgi:predicted transposase YbfD/YdcC